MGKHSLKQAALDRYARESIEQRDAEGLRTLLKKGDLNPNKVPSGSTLMHAAVTIGDVELIKEVINHPKTVLARTDENGRNVLQFALHTDGEIAYQLLQILTDRQLVQLCPYHCISEYVKEAKRKNSNTKHSLRMLQLLKDRGLKLPCACGHKVAHEIMWKRNSYALDAVLSPSIVNETHESGDYLLLSAAKQGHLPTVRVILMHGANTWDSSLTDISLRTDLAGEVRSFIRQQRRRRAVFYILKFRSVGAPLFSSLSFWLIKEIISLV